LTTSRRELLSSIFLHGKAPKKIYKILRETLGEYSPSYSTVKTSVAQFKLSTCDAPLPVQVNTVTTPEIIDQIHELILEDRRPDFG
jgi:TPP-dependent 2-oxoacid decarboxylase